MNQKSSIIIFWSDEDEGYIAVFNDLSKRSGWGLTPSDALEALNNAVEASLQAEEKLWHFTMFFTQCIEICAKERIGPDNYLWDLRRPGIWLEKFKSGMTPTDAVKSVFKAH